MFIYVERQAAKSPSLLLPGACFPVDCSMSLLFSCLSILLNGSNFYEFAANKRLPVGCRWAGNLWEPWWVSNLLPPLSPLGFFSDGVAGGN